LSDISYHNRKCFPTLHTCYRRWNGWDEMAGPEEKFRNDRHLYGHQWTFNQCSIPV